MADQLPKWKQDMLDRYNELTEQKKAIDLEYKDLEKALKGWGLIEKKPVTGAKRGRKKAEK